MILFCTGGGHLFLGSHGSSKTFFMLDLFWWLIAWKNIGTDAISTSLESWDFQSKRRTESKEHSETRRQERCFSLQAATLPASKLEIVKKKKAY